MNSTPQAAGLHVIVDDFNLEDSLFDDETLGFIRQTAEGGPDDLAAQMECFHLLKALSVPERASALALHDGYWSAPG